MALTNAQRQARWRAARRVRAAGAAQDRCAAGLPNPNAPIAAQQTRKANREADRAQQR